MDSYKITIDTFNKHAARYQEKYMYLDLYNDTYETFCELVEKRGACILEIACGPGNITKYMLNQRPDFKILATDMAPNMLELAKINNPAAEFQLMDCRDIDKINDSYDAIICGFVFPYLSKGDIAKLLRSCYSLLNTGGIIYLSTMEGNYSDSGYQTSSDGKDKAYIYYHQQNYIQEQLLENNFKIEEFKRKEFPNPNGPYTKDMIFIAKRQ